MLGYAGGCAGQLGSELLDDSWINTRVHQGIRFKTPSRYRWQAAMRLLGVDFTQISFGAGHS